MERGTWRATVHGIAKSDYHFHFHRCFTMVLVSAVQPNASATLIHISPLFWIPFPFRSQSLEWSSLCCTVGSH